MASGTTIDRERERVREIRDDLSGWRRWGPYVTDRSWGTVREDYSHDGDAWAFLPHDQARTKAYRWGEDGIAGLCDRYQLLCFAPAFWNGRDPILKERLFGLTPHEGNHGEDVKEYYFHLDNTPTHSYMKSALQVPAGGVPLPRAHRGEPAPRRTGSGVRAARHRRLRRRPLLRHRHRVRQGRPEDLAIRIAAFNRGPEPRRCTSCRTSGSATPGPGAERRSPSRRSRASAAARCRAWSTDDSGIDRRSQYAGSLPARPAVPVRPRGGESLFTDNETNGERVFGPGNTSRKPYVKDAFHRAICERDTTASTPTTAAPRRRSTTTTRSRRAARSRSACGSPTRRPPTALADVDTIVAAAQGRGRRVLRRARPARGHRRRAARPAPGAGRPALDASRSTSSTSRAGSTATIPAQPPPPSRRTIRNSTGGTSTRCG